MSQLLIIDEARFCGLRPSRGRPLNPDGHVFVSWKIQRDRLYLKWIEDGGPDVASPTHRGFGRVLLERGLASYDGEAELLFPREGLCCNISFVTAEGSSPTRNVAPLVHFDR